jgi:hypothetical protein
MGAVMRILTPRVRGRADGAAVAETTGALSAGLVLGPDFSPVWLGALLDVRIPYRWSDYGRQAGVVPAAGLAAGVDLPLARLVDLAVRADGWAGPMEWDGPSTLVYGGALRVGMAVPVDGSAARPTTVR